MKDKLLQILSAAKRNIKVTASVASVFLVVIILVAIFSDSNANGGTPSEFRWGDGITEGIPAFTGENAVFDAGENGEYAVAYYENVTGEGASVYIAKLEKELGVHFGKNGYPRVAEYGEKLIAVHYNVTEMTFSVTVTAKSNGEISSDNTQSGAQ